MEASSADQRAAAAQVAAWVGSFVSPGYGPGGGAKLVEQADGGYRWVRSAAAALREAALSNAVLQPHVELASAVASYAGDQATLAALLGARLVVAAQANAERGVPVVASLDGYALALRQARAELGALAEPDPEGTSLASVAHGRADLARLVMGGVRALAAADGTVPLDAVDVRTDGRGRTEPAWLPGVAVTAQFLPDDLPTARVPVLLLDDGWKPGPWREGLSYRMTAAHDVAAWSGAEDKRREEAMRHVLALGVRLVVSRREVDPELAGRLQQRGVAVANDAEEAALRRLARATGARHVTRLEHAQAADLGAATLRLQPHLGHLLVAGDGPAATLAVPGATEAARSEGREEAERLLRAAGLLLADPARLPGGGRWQRTLARRLRAAAAQVDGKPALAVRAAGDAFDTVADALVRNLGRDPLREGLAPGAADVWDPAPCVRVAVVAAFEAAIAMLRIDGVYAKAESTSAWLRGSQKMPKGMRDLAGDVPPDM